MKFYRFLYVVSMIGILSSLMLIMACGPSQENRPSGAYASDQKASPVLEPTRSLKPNPLNWLDASIEEAYGDITSQWENPDYLPEQHPITRRLQFWLDELHQELKMKYPERLMTANGIDVIPRPKVRVMIHEKPNAFISSPKTCYRVPIVFESQLIDIEEQKDTLLAQVSYKGKVGIFKRNQVSCIDRMDQKINVHDVMDYLHQNTKLINCEVFVKNNTVVIGSSCQLSQDHLTATASGILLESAANWITLTSGLLAQLGKEEFALAVLMHEAAHYYRSHGVLNKRKYNYFYQRNDDNDARSKPLEEPELNPLGAKLLSLPRYRTQPIPGQKFHSEIFPYMRMAANQLILPLCRENSSPCYEACHNFLNLALSEESQKLFHLFPQSQLSEDALAEYWRYETEQVQCFSAVSIGESGPNSLSPEAAQKVYWMTQVKDGLYPTLLAVLEEMNSQLLSKEAQNNELLQEAIDQGIGYYTTEEEADNLSLQWLAQLGVNPVIALDYWQRFFQMTAHQEQDSAYNFGLKTCLRLFHATPRWTENGEKIVVPIGSFADSHHSKCFRLYNFERRLNAIPFPVDHDRMNTDGYEPDTWGKFLKTI